MKLWLASRYAVDSLQMTEAPLPEPGPRQILLKVKAVSLNYRDKMVLEGRFGTHYPLPFVPASDAAGTVVAVGSDAHRFKPGDRVTTTVNPKWHRGKIRSEEESFSLGVPLPGVLAEYAVLDEDGLVKTPEYLSNEEASTLPVAAVTAWSALFERCMVQPGDTVLAQGTGGVSLFVLQLAHAAGAKVIVSSSSDEKLARARELGAHGIINYVRQPDWHEAARAVTNGLGLNHVIDVAGGDSVAQSLEALAVGGNIVVVGLLTKPDFTLGILPFIIKQATIHTLTAGSRETFEKMNRALEVNKIHPVIDSTYAFADVPKAFERLAQGAFGKIVIRVDS